MSDPNYPARKWHPETGETDVFNAPEDVPEGWLDTHPENAKRLEAAKAPVAKAKPGAPAAVVEPDLPMKRAEIRKELDAAGVEYPKNAPTQVIYNLLGDTAKTFLAANKIEYDPEADVPTLLALVKANAPK